MYTEEKYLLIQLLSHPRIRIYDFYVSTNFSIGQIVRVLLKYQKKGYLVILGKTIFRTPLGLYRLKKERLSDLAQNKRYWADVPKEMVGPRIVINEPLPIIRLPKKHGMRGMVSNSEM